MKTRLKNFLSRVKNTISRPEMRVLPGQLAFFFVLSMIPLIALVGALASQFSLPVNQIESALQGTIPTQVINLILPILSAKDVTVNMIIFYLSAFFLASNGAHSMIIASNSIYKIKDDSYLARRVKALFMTIVLVLILIFLFLVPVFGDYIIAFITKILPSTALKEMIGIIYNIVKYPLSLILVFFNIKLLYTMAPDKTIKSKDTTYGAVITTIGWIIATEIYSIYSNIFANYDMFYGSISNILILMLWVYILAYIFVLGMAMNASSEPA